MLSYVSSNVSPWTFSWIVGDNVAEVGGGIGVASCALLLCNGDGACVNSLISLVVLDLVLCPLVFVCADIILDDVSGNNGVVIMAAELTKK